MLIDNKRDRYPQDNKNIRTVWDFIRTFAGQDHLNPEMTSIGNLDIVTGYFTIRALSKLYREIPEEDTFRIVSSEMVAAGAEPNNVIDLLNGDNGIDATLNMADFALDAINFLKRETVQVRAATGAFCHAKAYLFKSRNHNRWDKNFYLTGSSNLTDAGLGLKTSANIELNIGDAKDTNDPNLNELSSWFEELWKVADAKIPAEPANPKSPRIDVKEYFIRQINEYYRKYTPQEIYYKILYELFNSDLELDNSIEHTHDMSLLQNSLIWKTLFNYQQKGVISLIKMLRKYGGAILADAVGLGKTFSALAVIKYFQEQRYLPIVLCPKKLEQNWEQYRFGHKSRFEKDELKYLIRFHSDLQNSRLETSYSRFNLSYLQSRKKILLVIDESHNLRNERSGRYQELINSLITNQPGVENRDVKVLMLSATPINTGLKDVKGQFNLIGHNRDDAFSYSDFGIDSLRNLFAEAQRNYTIWCKDPNRTIGGFVSMLPPRFFNLTDKLIVARTRNLIEKTLGENLGFPQKDKPINVYQGVERLGNLKTTADIYAAFDSLSLTAYQPSLFLHESRKEAKKEAAADWNDDVNRERFLVKMMGILFMKRLESSWHSCMSTVRKVLDVHEKTLQLVVDFRKNNGGAMPPDSLLQIDDANSLSDGDDDLLNADYSLRKGTIRLQDMKNIGGFERGLRIDVNKLRDIYKDFEQFREAYDRGEEHDKKLDELEKILTKKANEPNKKIVIFTAFADTAQFLFDELKKRGFTRMAAVSGQQVFTTGHQHTNNFTEILQSFAPYSKLYKELDWEDLYEQSQLAPHQYYNEEKQTWNVPYPKWKELVLAHRKNYAALLNDPIDILIATDCLSEGQNLQDADVQVNYDIHWNPVRLIQRFGRIDRIGSPNNVIHCVNFWPAKSFEEYLHLETRIQDRMSMMTLVGSETQELNEEYKKMIADNPLQDHNADKLLEQLKNNSISDIESPQTLSLKDFSFEVYRQDLLDYFDRKRDVFRKMPNGVYSGFRFRPDLFDKKLSESLIAVVGYPRREAGSDKPYTELYLMCQPVDNSLSHSPTFHELNRAEVLELLRRHKGEPRFLPAWIDETHHDAAKIQRLTAILKDWMTLKAPQQAISNIKNLLGSNNLKALKSPNPNETAESHFQFHNFDLIAWEYVTI